VHPAPTSAPTPACHSAQQQPPALKRPCLRPLLPPGLGWLPPLEPAPRCRCPAAPVCLWQIEARLCSAAVHLQVGCMYIPINTALLKGEWSSIGHADEAEWTYAGFSNVITQTVAGGACICGSRSMCCLLLLLLAYLACCRPWHLLGPCTALSATAA
jgi:hypothetical protein